MGLKEEAYIKYITGQGGKLNESSISPNYFQALSDLAERASRRGGQLLYDDYNTSIPNEGEIKATVGRTAKGNITREGNYWRIRDTYDFNPVEGGVQGDLDMARKALQSGDTTTALGRLTHASPFGTPYDVDIRVPMTPQQIQKYNPKATAADRAVFQDEMTFGGKRYKWQLSNINPTDSYTDIAARSFAGSNYKPEGSNLNRMQDMLMRRNRGYQGDANQMWMPVEIGDALPPAPKQAVPAKVLNNHLQKVNNNPTVTTKISKPVTVKGNSSSGFLHEAGEALNKARKFLGW